MAKIAIVGPGAIGGIMAGWLARDGKHEVIVCGRRPLSELTIETSRETFVVRPRVFTDPKAVPTVEWVLVATKAYDAAATAAWLPRLCAQGAAVAVLQNGVEHRERFAAQVPAERVVPVLIYCPAERTSPAHFRQRAGAKLLVPDDARSREFTALFAGTGIEASVTADWKSEAWSKLALNAAGILNALLLEPAGVFYREDIAELARDIMRECMAVGRAEGAVLSDDLPEIVLQRYRANPRDSVNSLHADYMAGRPMELEARNGIVVRLGLKHGIPTPCNRMAMTLLTSLPIGERTKTAR